MDNNNSQNKSVEQKIFDGVKEFGFYIALFKEEDGEPSFGYTIGLWKTFNHPEVILFGLATNNIANILNNIGMRVRAGQSMLIEDDDLNVFDSCPGKFIQVADEKIPEYFGYGMWFNDYEEFPALQIVWPDGLNKFPWESGFDKEFNNKQVILNNSFSEK